MTMIRIVTLLVLLSGAAQVVGTEHRVASAADITRLEADLRPGDTLVMADGLWMDQALVLRGRGTLEKPITLRAQTPGKVVLTGQSSLTLTGEHLVVSGLWLKDGRSTRDGIVLGGEHCRLTETAVTGGLYKFFVHFTGLENRMDHCYLAGKTSESPTVQIEVGATANHHQLDHNHFGPRPPLGRNGGETLRVGYSFQSMSNSATVVEQNLFERCDGEIEIISNKSCENVYRNNTFLDCAGMLTLRHGNRCLVEGNFFLAHHKRGSGGIRVIGEDHLIVNNYIDGVYQGGIWITAAIPDSPLVGYFRARNARIAFNTVVDSRGPCLDLSAGCGSSRRSLYPENITIANNLFAVSAEGTLLKGREGAGFKWLGNLASLPSDQGAAAPAHPGIRFADAKLVHGADGLWQPGPDSPARNAAEPLPAHTAGTAATPEKNSWKDAGCNLAGATARPLTAAEVGPAWRQR